MVIALIVIPAALFVVAVVDLVIVFARNPVIDDNLAELPTEDDPAQVDENPHLDPNRCRCDQCVLFVDLARAVTDARQWDWALMFELGGAA